jgi:serine/threonine protein kinase
MGFLDQVFGKKKSPALDKQPKSKPKPGLPPEISSRNDFSQPSPASPASKPPGVNIHLPGDRIAGRYEVASRPLMGGMGIVYLCYDHRADRPVALKTFRPEYLPDREARDRFLREGSIWVSLGKHPYIVRAYGVERIGDGSEVYLVLELIAKEEGRHDASLRSWLLPGKILPVVQTSFFAVQIVRALKHAGTIIPGFVHRDLKPENVLVGADRLISADINRIRVTDFGLASVLATLSPKREVFDEALQNSESHLRRTQLTRGIVGTPLYMAPEQWKGERVSIQTDMYALGCIVYEMVLGRTAVEGQSVEELMKAHCEGEVCRSLGNGHSSLWNFLRGCTAVEPKDRFQDWDSVEKTLKEIYYARTFGDKFVLEEKEETIDRVDRISLGWAQNAIGYSYLDLGKPETAIQYFKLAQAVGTAEGDQLLKAMGLNNQGLGFEALGDFDKAILSYMAALSIRDIKTSPLASMVIGNVGAAWRDNGDVVFITRLF